jgi:hypothetical protein
MKKLIFVSKKSQLKCPKIMALLDFLVKSLKSSNVQNNCFNFPQNPNIMALIHFLFIIKLVDPKIYFRNIT